MSCNVSECLLVQAGFFLFSFFGVFYREDHVIGKQKLFHLFLSDFNACIYFSWLIIPAGASSTMMNRCGESGPPCLRLGIGGNAFSFSLLIMMLAEDAQILTLIISGIGL